MQPNQIQLLRRRKRPAAAAVVRTRFDDETTTTISNPPPPPVSGNGFFNPEPVERLHLVDSKCGTGGFGSVVAVCDSVGRVMACKSQPWNGVSRNEYTLHRHLQPRGPTQSHPNVVRLLETRLSGNAAAAAAAGNNNNKKRSFLLFELADMDLLRLLRKQGGDWQLFPVAQRVAMLHDIARGLHFLHRKRVLHLDLKPANLLVFGRRCKIGDLGAAYLLPAGCVARELRDPRACVVTNPYRAPELMAPRTSSLSVTSAADIWSLGALVLDLFGMRAFQTSMFVDETRAKHPTIDTHEAELMAEVLQRRLVDEWLTPQPPQQQQTTAVPGLTPALSPALSPLENLVHQNAFLPTKLKPLVLAMLARSPSDRPSINTIVESLCCM